MDNILMVEISENRSVIKSNPIIEGRFSEKLSPLEMDLLTILFTTVEFKSDENNIIRLRVKDLISVLGMEKSKSAYKDLYNVSSRLHKRLITINESDGKWTDYTIISRATYAFGEGFGYIDFKFSDDIRPFIVDLQKYARFFLKYIIALDSFYNKRIYELIIQYRNMGNSSGEWSRTISLIELKKAIGANKDTYKLYGHLKERIINPAIAQISERTDIIVSIKDVKVGRRVEAVTFIATEKATPPEAIAPNQPGPDTGKDYARLVAYGVGEATARRLVKDYPADVVRFNLDQLDGLLRSKRGAKVENPAGWLVAGIEANRGEQLNLLTAQARKQDESKHREQRRAELSGIIKSVKTPYNDYRKKMVEAYISTLMDEENSQKEFDFREYIQKKGNTKAGALSFVLARLEKEGFTDAIVLPHFVDYLNEKGELSILSISAFAEKKGIKEYDKLRTELDGLEKEL